MMHWTRSTALKRRVGITRKKVNWVLDLDVQSFFDKIEHKWLVQFVEHRITDPRIVRLIQKWLKCAKACGRDGRRSVVRDRGRDSARVVR